jgi:methionyl-tRNA formyltransferase
MKMVFFGSSEFSVYVLDELKLHNILPALIITTPDKPKLVMTPTPVKVWAQENNIKFLDPASLKTNTDLVEKLKDGGYELFLVASYGKIIPKEIFEIPEKKTLNIHPSLLPKYRGASPIQSQILNNEKDIGVTIMQIEETMDTGPIIVQKLLRKASLPKVLGSPSAGLNQTFVENFSEQLNRKELEKTLAIEGAQLFAHILPEWLVGVIDPIMQDEGKATYCSKIKKEDGELQIDLNNMPTGEIAIKYLCKIKAFEEWPTTYFFHNSKRIIITDATIENDTLKILKVIPEGKKEMPFEDFMRGFKNPK